MDIIDNFIVLEGLDGAGTTTQLDLLCKLLQEKGRKVLRTFEPTDGEIGALIRRIQRGEVQVTSEALALLYASDRHNHLYGREGILSFIDKGGLVLSDRYFYSSIAYQSSFVDGAYVRRINDYPHPGILIFIDTPVEECMRRINLRSGRKEIFEKEEILKKVRNNYLDAFKNLPEGVRFLKIEGIHSIEETTAMIKDFLNL